MSIVATLTDLGSMEHPGPGGGVVAGQVQVMVGVQTSVVGAEVNLGYRTVMIRLVLSWLQ